MYNTVIITGATGTGKSTLAKMLLKSNPKKMMLLDGLVIDFDNLSWVSVEPMRSCYCLIIDDFDPDSDLRVLNQLIEHRSLNGLKTILIAQSVEFLKCLRIPSVNAILSDSNTGSINLLSRNTDLEKMGSLVREILFRKNPSIMKRIIELAVSGFASGFICYVLLWFFLLNPSEHLWYAMIPIGILMSDWIYKVLIFLFPKHFR